VNLANDRYLWTGVAVAVMSVVVLGSSYAQQGPRGRSSYAPVDITEPFSAILARLSAQKPAVERDHMVVLNERYDLSNRPAAGVTMDRTKLVQEGVRVKLAAGTTWESLAGMTPDQIRDGNLLPPGFLPLPHPKHQEGGMVFPRFLINEIKRQEGARPHALRRRFRHSRSLSARVPARDLSQSALGPRGCFAGPARHSRQLLPAVQRHHQSKATRGIASSGDAVSSAAVQPD
jgi:cytochrome c peroxidase